MRRFLAGLLAALMVLSLCACGAADAPGKTGEQTAAVSWDELVFDRTMPLRYAEQFSGFPVDCKAAPVHSDCIVPDSHRIPFSSAFEQTPLCYNFIFFQTVGLYHILSNCQSALMVGLSKILMVGLSKI